MQEQALRRREQELLNREFELVERELQLLIITRQAARSKPPLRKRTGPARHKLLEKFRNDPQYISSPSGMCRTSYCVVCTSCFQEWVGGYIRAVPSCKLSAVGNRVVPLIAAI